MSVNQYLTQNLSKSHAAMGCERGRMPGTHLDGQAHAHAQDLVARQAKFLTWYKRPGQRVLINPQGDLLVRPSFVEVSIHNRPLSSSVSQHMLLSYRQSFAAIVKAQLDRRKRLHVRAWPCCMQSVICKRAPALPGRVTFLLRPAFGPRACKCMQPLQGLIQAWCQVLGTTSTAYEETCLC